MHIYIYTHTHSPPSERKEVTLPQSPIKHDQGRRKTWVSEGGRSDRVYVRRTSLVTSGDKMVLDVKPLHPLQGVDTSDQGKEGHAPIHVGVKIH